ncbi:MAG: MarP family serine protease [Actinomycetota bacterium]|nr:MarP family serine protease [Actinomycetota bacterium]
MNVLDLFIVLFVVFLVWRGSRTGFLAGALSLVGVVLGAALGSRVVPALLEGDGDLVFGSVITLASIVAFAVLGDILARAASGFLQEKIEGATSEALDRAGGALLGVALSLTLVWVAATFALGTPLLSSLHPTMQESTMLGALNRAMPSTLLTQAVSRLDPIPSFRGPKADVADPNQEIAGDPEVLAATSRVVRVTGVACGHGIEGSGWVAAPDLVVTNAHVVAGEISTQIQPEGNGLPLPARVMAFDEKNDIAVLRVDDLRLSPLRLAEPRASEPVALLGFPENGPFDIRAGRVGETMRVISNDAYNRGPVERTVTSFKGFVRPGNSGGPAVNEDGEVVATVFASRADSDDAGYGIPSSLVQQLVDLAQERRTPVSTKECAT